jgi:hypothetical protein
MKKTIITLILFLLFSAMIQASDLESVIFESVESSVVYIEAALYLDKKYFLNQDVVKSIEDKYKSKILDSFVQIQTGSGMFVTKNGYVITNHHVIEINDLNMSKIEVYNDIVYHFLSKIPNDILNNNDYRTLKNDNEPPRSKLTGYQKNGSQRSSSL